MDTSPLISVVIPTYKRLTNLISAVHSVKKQSFQDWELIISDDEKPFGETWEWLQAEAKNDVRIKPVQNLSEKGQIVNTNYGMSQATGQYIKILHDDDILLPNCLDEFRKAVLLFPDIAVASCRMKEVTNGSITKEYRGLHSKKYIVLTPKQAGRYMYLQRDAGEGLPTAMLIKRSVISNGGQMPQLDYISYCIDSAWNMHLLQFGARLVINKTLAEHHFGSGTKSLTSEITEKDYIAEIFQLRRYQQSILTQLKVKVPSPDIIRQQLQIIFALRRLFHLEFNSCFKLLLTCWHPYSWLLFVRYCFDTLATTRRTGSSHKKQ